MLVSLCWLFLRLSESVLKTNLNLNLNLKNKKNFARIQEKSELQFVVGSRVPHSGHCHGKRFSPDIPSTTPPKKKGCFRCCRTSPNSFQGWADLWSESISDLKAYCEAIQLAFLKEIDRYKLKKSIQLVVKTTRSREKKSW